MHHVFLSYSRRNTQAVREVLHKLEAKSIPTWMDTTGLQVSVPWDTEIGKAILASTLVVVFDSPDWRASAACRSEAARAEQSAKVVVRLPLAGLDAEDGAAYVARVYRDLIPREVRRTERLVRATEWQARDDGYGVLASPGLMKTLALQVGEPVGKVELDYIKASIRRNRRRRTFAVLGSLLSLALVVSPFLLQKIDDRAKATLATATAGVLDHADADGLAHYSPYAALTRAGQRVTAGDESYLDVSSLMTSLAINVPDLATSVTNRTAVALVPTSPGDMGVVDTARDLGGAGAVGSPIPGLTAADGPVLAAAADGTGAHLVVSTASAAVGLDGIAKTRVACGGSLAASGPTGADVVAGPAGLCLWSSERPSPVRVFAAGITSVTVAGGDTVAGFADGSIARYPQQGGKRLLLAHKGPGAVTALAADPAGDLIAVGRRDSGQVEFRSASTGETDLTAAVSQPPTHLVFNADGRLLAAAGGSDVSVVDTRSGQTRQPLRGNFDPVTALAWSPAGDKVWAATATRVLRWTWRQGPQLLDDPTQWITDAQPLRGGGIAAITRSDDLIVTHADAVTVRTHISSPPPAQWLSASYDGTTVAVSGASSVTVDRLAGNVQKTYEVAPCGVEDTAFSRDARMLYVACAADGVKALDLASGRVVAESGSLSQNRFPFSITVAPDGSLLIGGFHGEVITMGADLKSPDQVNPGTGDSCYTARDAVAVSPTGSTAVVVGNGGADLGCLELLYRKGGSWSSNTPLLPFTTSQQARAVTFSPDGSMAAVGFGDGTVAILEVGTGNPGMAYYSLTGAVRGLAFTEDGKGVIAATRDGLIEQLPACPGCGSPQSLAKTALQRVSRATAWGLAK